ncbi:MAG: invasion associated locus B family protein [Proteobacteria bacterium]|nr:invasion associated locus B family protein [Pseudomonadota bacterium]
MRKRHLIVLMLAFAGAGVAHAENKAPQLTTATYDDWTVRCEVRDTTNSCEMSQSMQIKGQSQPVSQIAIGRLNKTDPLKLVFQVPINVWIPDNISLVVEESATTIKANFTRCIPAGCFAETDLKDDMIVKLGKVSKGGRLEFSDAGRQKIAIPVSFKGFAAAYDGLSAKK